MKLSVYVDTDSKDDMDKLAKVAAALSEKKKLTSKELDEHIKRTVLEVMANNPAKSK